MKKIILTCLILCLLLQGCVDFSNTVNNKSTSSVPDIWGDELNNVELAVCYSEKVKTYSFQFMSNIKITNDYKVELDYTGGNFDFKYEIEKGEYSIEDYDLYYIRMEFTNFKFDDSFICIDKINVRTDGQYIEIVPDKFIIHNMIGEFETESWYLTNTSMIIPLSGNTYYMTIAVNNPFYLEEICLSNESFCVKNSNEWCDKEIDKLSDSQIELKFSVEETSISEYVQYTSSIVFKYEIDEQQYVKDMIADITYNPFTIYENNFEKYYNEVLLGK